jgi:hypothetical protein
MTSKEEKDDYSKINKKKKIIEVKGKRMKKRIVQYLKKVDEILVDKRKSKKSIDKREMKILLD